MQLKSSNILKSGPSASLTLALMIACVSMIISGCGASQYPQVSAITFPDSQGQNISSVVQGTAISLSATVTNDPKTLGIDWSVTCTSTGPSGCGTFGPTHTASGAITSYTAPAYPPTGAQVVIIATATQDPTRSTSATLTISGPPINLTLQPTTATVPINATAQFTATLANDPATAGATWTLTCASGGTLCGTVSPTQTDSGSATIYTAPSAVPSGTITLTATSVTDTSKTATSIITVTLPPPVSIVFAQPPPTTLQTTSQLVLTANVLNDSSDAGVDWTVTCSTAGACGTLTSSHTANAQANQYTAPATIPTGGSVTITAISTAAPTQQASVTIQIIKANLSVAVTPASSSVLPGGSVRFAATVTGDSANAGVKWTASAGTFSPTQSASGTAVTYTAPQTIPSGGTATITATSITDSTRTATAIVSISATQEVSVSVTPPTASIQAGSSGQFTATVSGDSSSMGVSWTATSGTLSPAQTTSGAATTYTAPSDIPTGGTATITATSLADTSKSATATVNISAAATGTSALLNGSYAFVLRGYNTESSPNQGFFVMAGSITADGNGNITAGELDSNSGTVQQASSSTFTGTYTIQANGQGSLKLHDIASGGGDQILSLSIANAGTPTSPATHALLESANGAVTLTGALDRQTPGSFTTPLSGAFSFNLLETAPFPGSRVPCNLGGVLTVAAGNVTNLLLDSNVGGVFTSTSGPLTAPLGAADANGRGTLDLSSSGQGVSCSSLQFVYYIVDAGHIVLVDQANPGIGEGFLQPATLPASLVGKYAFTDYGFTANANPASIVAAGGLFTCDANGNLTAGTLDVNNAGTFQSGTITGTCKLDSTADGRAIITISHGGSGGVKKFAAYVTASDGLLLLGLDASQSGVGTAYVQSTGVNAASFTGSYASYLQAYTPNGEESLLGPVIANGTAALTGTVDVNTYLYNAFASGQFSPGLALTGATLADAGGGRLTGTVSTSATGGLQQVFYVVDSNLTLSLQSDSNPGVGILQLQNLPAH